METQNRPQQILTTLSSALIFCLFCTTLVIPSGFGSFATLLLATSLLGLALGQRINHQPRPLHKWERYWLLALVLIFISSALSTWIKPSEFRSFSNLDVPFRFLLVIPVFLFLRRVSINPLIFWSSLAIGGIGAGGFALYQKVTLNTAYAQGAANHHIVFGDVALTLGFLSILSIGHFRQFRLGWLLPVLGLIGGLTASILSGARGGWIAVPMLLVALAWFHRKRLSPATLAIGIALFITTCMGLYQTPETNIKTRVTKAINETQAYLEGKNYGGSLPQRYEMFKSAWILFKEKPLLGIGTDAYQHEVKRLWKEGQVQRIGAIFTHPHNEYLSALAMKGIIGLAAVLFLFSIPFIYLLPLLPTLDKVGKTFAMAGIITNLAYVQFALSEAILDRMLSLMFYLFVMAVIFSFIRPQTPLKH